MSVYLDRVRELADERENAERAFRVALREAALNHSLAQVADAAGLSKSGVHYLLRGEQER